MTEKKSLLKIKNYFLKKTTTLNSLKVTQHYCLICTRGSLNMQISPASSHSFFNWRDM